MSSATMSRVTFVANYDVCCLYGLSQYSILELTMPSVLARPFRSRSTLTSVSMSATSMSMSWPVSSFAFTCHNMHAVRKVLTNFAYVTEDALCDLKFRQIEEIVEHSFWTGSGSDFRNVRIRS